MNNQFCLSIKICLPCLCRHKLLEYGTLRSPISLVAKQTIGDQGYIRPDLYQVQNPLYLAFLSQFTLPLQRSSWLVQVHHILFSDDVALTLVLEVIIQGVPNTSSTRTWILLINRLVVLVTLDITIVWFFSEIPVAGVNSSKTVLVFSSFLPFPSFSCEFSCFPLSQD